MSTKKTEVAVAQTKELSTALGFDMGNDAGSGMEGADKDSFAIPFLSVLQKISPQVDEADAKYIEGAKGSMLLNTVTQQLYDGKEGLVFLPCSYQRRFLRWGPRGGDGGGFKGDFLPDVVARMKEAGEVVEQEGRLYFPLDDGRIDPKRCDHLADVRNHFGLIYDEVSGATFQVLLSLGSTQIKKSKQLLSLLAALKVQGPNGMVTPPTWISKIRLTTVIESNDKGSWYGLKMVPEGFIANQELYNAGKAFHSLIADGGAKVDYAAADEASKPESDDNGF